MSIKRSLSKFNILSAYFAPLQNTYDGVMDLEKAIMLFDEIADIPNMPHGYLDTGCYERSVIITDLLAEAGYTPKRVWLERDNVPEMLEFESPDNRKIKWSFHVAPLLEVKAENGQMRNMVLDPSMFNGPVSLGEWVSNIKGEKRVQILPYQDIAEFILHSWYWDKEVRIARRQARKLMRKQKKLIGRNHRTVLRSSLKDEFMRVSGRALEGYGQTWRTWQSYTEAKQSVSFRCK